MRQLNLQVVANRILSFFPFIQWIRTYKLSWLRYDLLGGLTVGLTLVPQALAYAQLAKLPPQYGLYTSYVGLIVYAFLGTARDVNLGPASVMSLLVGDFNAVNPLGPDDPTYALYLSFVSGLILLLMGIFRLGFLVNFFSIPVTSGFTSAAAIVIIVSQLKFLLGLSGIRSEFYLKLYDVARKLPQTNLADLACGSCALVFILSMRFGGERFIQAYKSRLPSILVATIAFFVTCRNIIAVIISSGIAAALETHPSPLNASTSTRHQLTLTGTLPQGFPAPFIPIFHIQNGTETIRSSKGIFADLQTGFIIIPIIIALEQFAVAKALSRKNNYNVDASQELVAAGVANTAGAFFSAYPVTASLTRSALNSQSKVKTPATGLVAASLIILSITVLTVSRRIFQFLSIGCIPHFCWMPHHCLNLFFQEYFKYIPAAALAAIIMCAALHMFDHELMRDIWGHKRSDLFPFSVSFFCTLFVGLEYGILIGCVVSLCMYMAPVAHIKFYKTTVTLSNNKEAVTVMRVAYGLKYPSVDRFVYKVVSEASKSHYPIIIDFKFVNALDYTALLGIKQICREVNSKGKMLVFANLRPKLKALVDKLRLEHFHSLPTTYDCLSIFNQFDTMENLWRHFYGERQPYPHWTPLSTRSKGNDEDGATTGGSGDTLHASSGRIVKRRHRPTPKISRRYASTGFDVGSLASTSEDEVLDDLPQGPWSGRYDRIAMRRAMGIDALDSSIQKQQMEGDRNTLAGFEVDRHAKRLITEQWLARDASDEFPEEFYDIGDVLVEHNDTNHSC